MKQFFRDTNGNWYNKDKFLYVYIIYQYEKYVVRADLDKFYENADSYIDIKEFLRKQDAQDFLDEMMNE